MWRIAAFIGVVVLATAAVVVGLAWLASTLVGPLLLTAVVPVVAVILALLIVVRLVLGLGRAAAPLGELIEASGRVEAGEVGTQVDVRGPREVRALARAFNAMSSRLAADTDDRRRLLADVSHELRTPLTVIRGNVEGMLDGLYPADRPHLERLLAETRHMEQLVDDLRTLALSDAGALGLQREPVDLRALAEEVVAGFIPQAEEGGLELAVIGDAVRPAELDPRRVHQVIANLVANALRHTPEGGRVVVEVAEPDPSTRELVVRDTGRGMDESAAAHAFDRFWRAGDEAGAGLGLAIVRDLVEAHGGTVSLESEVGRGTVVRCRFPRGRADEAGDPA